MHRFPHLAQKLWNQPLMIHPQKAEIVMAAMGDRLGITQLLRGGQTSALILAPELDDDMKMFSQRADWKPYAVQNRIAIIQVEGTLVQKLGCLRPYSGMTGYDGIRTCFLTAMQDDDVDAVILQIDSPGGEVFGCFDLVDTIFASRGEKPIWAVLDECACSAAYAIASAADRITIPRTGVAGSIGVIAIFADLSAALTKAGITVNIIQFGDRKADGNESIPLPSEARQKFQQQIDELGELFVATVSRNRNIAPKAVIDTQAATFLGADAKKLGLADEVASPDAAFEALLEKIAA